LATATVTLPKLILVGTTVICGWIPVPLSEMANGEFVALLETLTNPDKLPMVVGANVIPKEALWPAASVSGRVEGANVKPEPVSLIAELVTLELPVLEMVTVCVALVPVS